MYRIITFYEFKDMNAVGELSRLKTDLREAMTANAMKGTVILAAEGFNSTVCGKPADVERFIGLMQSILETKLKLKSSFSVEMPFQKIDVKIKPEIVALKKDVDITLGAGTHVKPADWNAIIADPNVIVLDARNSYEFESGTFVNAINPGTEKFSDLPEFVEKTLDPNEHKQIAMFCTGGIRCEKFAPYLKARGFETIFQLEGGILKYLEEIPLEEQLWKGECYVFDKRVTVNEMLEKGRGIDLSQKENGSKAAQ